MLKAIIFDMDGVLINSTPYIRESLTKTLKEYGVNIDKLDKKKYHGKRLVEQIPMWKNDFNIKNEINIDEFAKKASEIQFKLMKDELKPDNNIIKLIKEAQKEGIKLAVSTGSTKKRAIKILNFIGVFDYLDILIASEDVKNGKPNPEGFLKAAKSINIEPKNCLVIEDALHGIQAAKKANMKVIGKFGPYHIKEELQIADMVFEDFKEIKLEDLKKLFT